MTCFFSVCFDDLPVKGTQQTPTRDINAMLATTLFFSNKHWFTPLLDIWNSLIWDITNFDSRRGLYFGENSELIQNVPCLIASLALASCLFNFFSFFFITGELSKKTRETFAVF